MRAVVALSLVCLALAMCASTHEYGTRTWAVLVFLSVTAFIVAVMRVHAFANTRRDR